jgi:hypothetical protein
VLTFLASTEQDAKPSIKIIASRGIRVLADEDMVHEFKVFARTLYWEFLQPHRHMAKERMEVYEERIHSPIHKGECLGSVERRFPSRLEAFLQYIQPKPGSWANLPEKIAPWTEADPRDLASASRASTPDAGGTRGDAIIADSETVRATSPEESINYGYDGNQLEAYRNRITPEERMEDQHAFLKENMKWERDSDDEDSQAWTFSQTTISTPVLSLSNTGLMDDEVSELERGTAASAVMNGSEDPNMLLPNPSGYSTASEIKSTHKETASQQSTGARADADAPHQPEVDDNLMGIPALRLPLSQLGGRRSIGDPQAEARANILESFIRSRLAKSVAEPSSPLGFLKGHHLWAGYNKNLPHFGSLTKVLTPTMKGLAYIFGLDVGRVAFLHAMYEPTMYNLQPDMRIQVLVALLRIQDAELAKFLEWVIVKEKYEEMMPQPANDEDILRAIIKPMVQTTPEEAKLTRLKFPPGLASFAHYKQLGVIEIGNLRSIFTEENLNNSDVLVEELSLTFGLTSDFADFLFNQFEQERDQAWK